MDAYIDPTNCFLCSKQFNTIKALVEHFSEHILKHDSLYKCVSCDQSISRRHNFIRHLKKFHLIRNSSNDNIEDKSNVSQAMKGQNDPNIRNDSEFSCKNMHIYMTNNTSSGHQSNQTSGTLDFELEPSTTQCYVSYFSEELLEELKNGALEFSLKMHSKPSIPRKTLVEVQDIISHFVESHWKYFWSFGKFYSQRIAL